MTQDGCYFLTEVSERECSELRGRGLWLSWRRLISRVHAAENWTPQGRGKRKPVQVALRFLELGVCVGDPVAQKLFLGKVSVFKLNSSSFLPCVVDKAPFNFLCL